MYVLTNGFNYLMYDKLNKLTTTTNENNAIKFVSKEKALNLLSNMPKKLSRLGYEVKFIKDNLSNEDEIPPELPLNFPTYEEILAKVEEFEEWYEELMAYKDRCAGLLEIYNDQQQDIIHAIEFQSCNACDGYKMYKQLHDIRLNRRKNKDALLVLQILQETFGDSMEKVKASHRIKGISNRKYCPRNLVNIFKENS